MRVCVFALFIYTISISIIFVSKDEPSLVALINRYTTFAIEFLKRKDNLESKFLISVNYSFNHLM